MSPGFHFFGMLNHLLMWLVFFQKDDLKAVVNHLRADGSVSCIGLWGRSMGAVTRYSHRKNIIYSIVSFCRVLHTVRVGANCSLLTT